jgi:HTH-type transcriptional regulator, competence development regulator
MLFFFTHIVELIYGGEYMFVKESFSKVLQLALGDRTKEDYAKESGVSRAYISKCINKRIDNPPSPEILKRLADKAHNGVTYNDLMQTAGYIVDNSKKEKELYTAPLSDKDEIDIEKRLEKLRKDLASQSGLMLSGEAVSEEALEAIFESLASGVKYAKMINKKYTPKKYRKNKDEESDK